MVFINRISQAIQKNTMPERKSRNVSFGADFPYDALAKNNLSQDVWQKKVRTTPVRKPYIDAIPDDSLALRHPELFIGRYLNKNTADHAFNTNPNIALILDENGLEPNCNLQNVYSIISSHLMPVSKTTQKIYKNLGHSENEENYLYLTQAALLHDIGKIYIPEEILNKKGKLTPEERAIVELHNRLSYEILKTTDLNPKVAKLALEHHNYAKDVVKTDENQALTVADKYCALREKRSYKKPMDKAQAIALLYDMGLCGDFDINYIKYIA